MEKNYENAKRIEIGGKKFVIALRRFEDNTLIFFDSKEERKQYADSHSDEILCPLFCEV